MATDLATIEEARLKDLVASLPANKRAAFAKAAKAACQHLRDSRANYAKAYQLASAMVENWWRLGIELNRLDVKPGQPKKNPAPGQNTFRLSDLGVNAHQSARCQKLAELSKAELDDWLESKYDADKYYLPSLRPAAEGVHVANNSGEVEWYTPPDIIEKAREVLGEIDLDPCTSDVAQGWINAAEYCTQKENGLQHHWAGRVWMNPPYESGCVEEFTTKLAEHYRNGDVTAAVVLVNNATETKWYQALATYASAVCFPAGRIRFHDSSGEPANMPLQGQCVLYLGESVRMFCKVFGSLGMCFERAA